MSEMEYKVGTIAPWYQRRWWLQSREVEPIIYPDGKMGACHELYVPFWAWPLDLLHRLIFGSSKLSLIDEE